MKNSSRTGLQRAAIAVLAASAMMLSGCSSGPSAGASASASSSAGNITVNNVEPAAGLIPTLMTLPAGRWLHSCMRFDAFDAAGKLVCGHIHHPERRYLNTPSNCVRDSSSPTARRLRLHLREIMVLAANAPGGRLGAAIFSTIRLRRTARRKRRQERPAVRPKVVTTLRLTSHSPPLTPHSRKVGDVAFLPLPASAWDIDAFGACRKRAVQTCIWSHDKEIKLVPNPRYTGPRKAKRGVTCELYTSLDAAYSDLLAGNLDVLDSIPSSALNLQPRTTADHEQGWRVSNPSPSRRMWRISPARKASFAAPRSRAVDREAIIKKVLYGTATRATDFTAPTIAGYSKILSGASVLDYDAAQARKLWKQRMPSAHGKDFPTRLQHGQRQAGSTRSAILSRCARHRRATADFLDIQELSTAIHNRTVGAAFIKACNPIIRTPKGIWYRRRLRVGGRA